MVRVQVPLFEIRVGHCKEAGREVVAGVSPHTHAVGECPPQVYRASFHLLPLWSFESPRGQKANAWECREVSAPGDSPEPVAGLVLVASSRGILNLLGGTLMPLTSKYTRLIPSPPCHSASIPSLLLPGSPST